MNKGNCKCKNKKHQCAFNGCQNHVMYGIYTGRYLSVCYEHFNPPDLFCNECDISFEELIKQSELQK